VRSFSKCDKSRSIEIDLDLSHFEKERTHYLTGMKLCKVVNSLWGNMWLRWPV